MPTQRRFPAEWEPQSAVMLTWPHQFGDWHSRLASVEPVFLNIARAVTQHEYLLINCYDLHHKEHVQKLLEQAAVNSGNVILHICKSNDSWARDHGPVTVMENDCAEILDFTFNGWGEKYPANLDNAITGHLASMNYFGKTGVTEIDLVMEGGSLESDGADTILTTTRCLLHPKRNPGMNRKQIEQRLGELLGTERVLWLEHGALSGDDTDGHIDMLARFVSPDSIVYQSCSETGYQYYDDLIAMKAELEKLVQPDGQPYRLRALPWPTAQINTTGDRLPASYANFLIINNAVLVPVYQDDADEAACETIQSVCPDREVIPVNCRPLIEQFGSLHCVTMQLPEAVDLQPGK